MSARSRNKHLLNSVITKYHDLSMASRSIICQRRRLREIIYLRDTDKSRYFVITEFTNLMFSLSITKFVFIFLNHSLTTQGSDLPFSTHVCGYNYAWTGIICSKAHLDGTAGAHEQTIICRQLFAHHAVGSRPMKRRRENASNNNYIC